MNKINRQEIIRTLAAEANEYPPDDLIITYADFLKNGQYLCYNKYNPLVLERLSALTDDLWSSSKRISRITLLTTIKKYVVVAHYDAGYFDGYYKKGFPVQDIFTESIKSNLFSIFKKVHTGPRYLTEKQQEEGKQISNYFLKYSHLNPDDLLWLCENALSSLYFLNRILRYPAPSTLITSWAKENVNTNKLRSRRAELTSWIIDEDLEYQINTETLIADFEYQNNLDKKTFEDYIDEIDYHQHLADELGDIFDVKKISDYRFDGLYKEPEILDGFTEPTYTLSKRFYKVPLLTDKQYNIQIPDFDTLSKTFYNNLNITRDITMIWSIAYSRLDVKTKTELLKNYYHEHTITSLIKVAIKFDFIPLLKWMVTK